MRILDKDGNELKGVNFNLGYYILEQIVIAHHPAQEYIPEQWHYEVIAEYPNGGKDIEKVIDVPGQEAREAWDEFEDILRWYWYADENIQPFTDLIVKQNIEKNAYFVLDNILYYSLSAIPMGTKLKIGENCNKMDMATVLNDINLKQGG